MHLLFFWLLLLPVGRTLRLSSLLGRSEKSPSWVEATVPGFALRCFLANVAIIYLVSGLWKLESPMWRDGFALYPTLRLPIARYPDAWAPEHLPLLTLLTHATLIVEPLIPVLLLLPQGKRLKWLGLVLQLAFHAGIIATLRIPFANLGCMATTVLFFRGEIMGEISRRRGRLAMLRVTRSLGLAGRAALAFLFLLTLAMTRRAPVINVFAHEAIATLWVAGIAQDYQLFNWIDKKNFYGKNAVWRRADGAVEPLDPAVFFPATLRGALLQTYVHDVRWLKIPAEQLEALKRSILSRAALRYCRRNPGPGTVALWTTVQRITPANARISRGEEKLVLELRCEGQSAVVCQTLLGSERNPACPDPPPHGPEAPPLPAPEARVGTRFPGGV